MKHGLNRGLIAAAALSCVAVTVASCAAQKPIEVRAALPSVAVASPTPAPATPGRSTNSNTVLILSGGYERSYRVHVPLSAPNGPRPLIIALHGGGGSPGGMEYGIGLDSAADRAGIYVVYPEGIGGFWNNGRPVSVVHSGGVNDYQFVVDVLADAEHRNDIDPNRVFLTGQGDGAALALQVAARYPGLFAGVVAVSGQFVTTPGVPMPTVPMSVIFIHGTDDPFYPVAGIPDTKTGPIDSLAHTVGVYTALDHVGAATTTQLPDRAPLDGTTITQTTWAPGPGGYSVTLYTVQGGGSPWPGGSVDTRDLAQNGRTSQSLDASGVVEHFALETHRETPASAIPALSPSSTILPTS